MSLVKYKEKRNFKDTPEPADGTNKKVGKLVFVIQRHKASRLHYDFRLEMEGVLKSWAVPKGPSLNPADKRLAMMVEDHPFSYRTFKGIIPEGNYGAGIVEIWDEGEYIPVDADSKPISEKEMLKALKTGSIKFELKGKKVKGEFALVKLKAKEGNAWLLIKHRDKHAVDEEYNSEYETEKNSPINRFLRDAGKDKSVKKKGLKAEKATASKEIVTRRAKHKPMLATLGKNAFDDNAWIYEIKWDGYRAIAEIDDKSVNLYSRNGISFNTKFAPIAQALTEYHIPMVLDGEVVVPDENGKADFQQLQHFDENPDIPIFYHVFDILELNGKSLRDKPLLERKKILEGFIKPDRIIKYCDHIVGRGKDFFKLAVQNELEGMIAKRSDSLYYEGKRTPDWLKIKHHNTDEAIICGYTAPQGGRKYFGSLVLGIHDKTGKLVPAGNVGTGFTDFTLKQLYEQLQELKTTDSPFTKKVSGIGKITWVKPELVCNVKFMEWTKDNSLRHPVYQGLREDLSAEEIKKPVAMSKKEADVKAKEKKDVSRTINGKKLELTNLNKVYWPEEGITKGQVMEYYESISTYILPYLKDRPESLKRNPGGINDPGFFHKDAGDAAPDWVKSIEIHSDSGNKDIDYILCNDLPTLLYLNNLGCIEINPWNSTTNALDKPSYMVIDLDPADNQSFEDVITTALVVKNILDKAGADSYCKTSGSSGLHIYVPLGAKYSYEQCKQFAEIIAQLTVAELPEITTILRPLNKRKGRLYVDFLQNRRGQTLACAYSLRPKAGATVSTPLLWEEVKPGLHPSQFTMFTILERVEKLGDLFKPVLGKGVNLEKCLTKLIG